MPYAIDEEAFAKQETLDLTRPQGTKQGLPVKQIPHMDFPRVVYRWPAERFYKVEHRNVHHEVVEVETVAAEHKTHLCKNKTEFDRMLKEGWKAEPYIPPALPDPQEHLYQ